MGDGHGEKLTRKMSAAIVALMESPTVEAAALACGVAASTLYRWLKLPKFRAAYHLARTRAVDHAIARLQRCAAKAVETLEKNMGCDKPMVANAAALGVLDRMVRMVEHAD